MAKKIRNLFLLFLLLLLLGLWSPWNDWDINILRLIGIDTQDEYATLKVKSLAGTIEILVDDLVEGTVNPEDGFAEINTITKGDHMIKLRRPETINENYYELNKKINFEPGIEVVIAYDLGPSQIFSEGHILYTTKRYGDYLEPELNILSNPSGVSVFIDETEIGSTPVKGYELDIKAQHTVRFELQGFDPLEFVLLPESQEARDELNGLSLNLEVNLFLQPIEILNDI